ncbi:MAG: MarR family transcriptional regulator [Chitinophaga sp.]|uniref:MarR family winged helix-turn-helix transcriptional regulator n=1 Tax=Chitinophaga sp. TaxID=1869181 RepID=UPI001B22A9D6|nr:MarR family transcriptional regulator [Chitinophaga sp.]MBO9732652.1 MarR family transcriptional regulator [Chitinophaga sp.]
MSELVKLISAWEEYAQKNTTTSALEFCMYFLAKESNSQLFSGLTPPDLNTVFAKLVGRLAAMQTAYSKMALQEIPGFELDWFYYLNAILHFKEVRKTQIIQYNFTEQTTGIDILNKLKKLGYIAERSDPDDKRAKLVRLTAAGEKILYKVYPLLDKSTQLMYSNIDNTDKQVIINLLKDTERQHQLLFSNSRNKSLDDLLVEVLGEEKIAQMEREQKKRAADFQAAKRHHKK